MNGISEDAVFAEDGFEDGPRLQRAEEEELFQYPEYVEDEN